MGRSPCCDKTKVKRGPWSPEEDNTLKNYLHKQGTAGSWISLPQKAGLKRCGKSCRLRWLNYLRPNIKHGGFTEEEDSIILALYRYIVSRWSVIASQLPGRTDNDVKNYWNTKLKKKLSAAAAATSSFVRNSEFDDYEEILCGSRVKLPRLIHAPEIENARDFPFSAAINTNGSIINGLCGDEEAFGFEFNSGFMPFGNLNDLEKFRQSNKQSKFWILECGTGADDVSKFYVLGVINLWR